MDSKSSISLSERTAYALSFQNGLVRARQITSAAIGANGTTWVDLLDQSTLGRPVKLIEMTLATGGSWTGAPVYRIVDKNSGVLYPYAGTGTVQNGTAVALNPAIIVPCDLGFKLQFKSTATGDASGSTVALTSLNVQELI